MDFKTYGPATTALHFDRDMDPATDVAPPLHLASTHAALDADDFARLSAEPFNDHFYGSHGNPTASRPAAIIARLEGAESGLLTASGMGAMTAAVLAHVKAGDHVIGQNRAYMGATKLLTEVLPRFGVETSLVDHERPDAFAAALRPNTRLILLESPVNPTLRLTDLRAVADIARAAGVLTLCDNTLATPLVQRPIDLGVDIVVHSATKYIGGHHDLLAGVVVSRRALLEPVWDLTLTLGAVPGPFNAWLALRGLRTLKLRVTQQCQTAAALAEHLSRSPKVSAVHYPGLKAHPQHDLAVRQMSGFGGLLSFEMAGGFEAGRRLIERLRLPLNAGSLGGVESLIIQPAAMWGGRLDAAMIAQQGFGPGLIRMAVGVEETHDLIDDLDQALDGV